MKQKTESGDKRGAELLFFKCLRGNAKHHQSDERLDGLCHCWPHPSHSTLIIWVQIWSMCDVMTKQISDRQDGRRECVRRQEGKHCGDVEIGQQGKEKGKKGKGKKLKLWTVGTHRHTPPPWEQYGIYKIEHQGRESNRMLKGLKRKWGEME